MERIERLGEMGDVYTIVANQKNELFVEFKVYEIEGDTYNPATNQCDLPLYARTFESRAQGETEKLEEAEVFAEGTVKWDGCSNWNFPGISHVMLHRCDRDGLIGIGTMLARCWDIAKEMIGPKHIDYRDKGTWHHQTSTRLTGNGCNSGKSSSGASRSRRRTRTGSGTSWDVKRYGDACAAASARGTASPPRPRAAASGSRTTTGGAEAGRPGTPTIRSTSRKSTSARTRTSTNTGRRLFYRWNIASRSRR